MLDRNFIKSINSWLVDWNAIGLLGLFFILFNNILSSHFNQKDICLFKISSLIFLFKKAPPPNETTILFNFNTFKLIFSSNFLKYGSPLYSKIFEIFIPNLASICSSISKKSKFYFLETDLPIDVFPEPIIPKKTIFFFDFISFFIEKTQICLNLKLTKVICNLLKKQVQALAFLD